MDEALAQTYKKGPSVSDSSCRATQIVVLKVGGSVLTGSKAFRKVALYLKHRCDQVPGEKLLVVVSAQKLATDSLERRARRIVRLPSARALDLLWCTGELRSVALLALHLEAVGVSSVGLNVHETGLRCSREHHSRAATPTLRDGLLEAALGEHAVVVVPGFLATSADGTILSLGRGGSDLSAVLLAVGLRAGRCELVKDVPGYFEDDPHENARAAHLPWLSFECALRMADRGCDLVQPDALLAAAAANLTLVIRSVEERDPVSVISRSLKIAGTRFHHERVAAEA